MTDLQIDMDYVAGESIERAVQILDENDDPADLTGISADWHLVPTKGDPVEDAILTDADEGVTVDVDSDADEIVLTIERGVTDDLGGRDLWHRFVIDDATIGRDIPHGEFIIKKQ